MSSNFIETQNPGAEPDFCCKYIGEYPQICRKIKGQVRLRLLLDPRVLIASILGFILCVYMPINSVFLFCWWVWYEPGWYNILFLCLQILWLPFFTVYTGIMSSAFFRYDSLHIDILLKEMLPLPTEDDKNDYNQRVEPLKSSGSRICGYCKTLDRIARQLNCTTISSMGFEGKTWFPPEEGLKTTNALIEYFAANSKEDPAWLQNKLHTLKIALEYARDRQSAFCFIIVQ